MTRQLWTAVDEYLISRLVPDDAELTAAREASDRMLPGYAVAPNQGRLLYILARAIAAHAILEIGTLGGYSTIWLARALPPGGRVVTLEADPRYAELAAANIRRAGLADAVDIRAGLAEDTLRHLSGPFDLVFVDADKPNIPQYVAQALALSRPGGLIIVDNVVRDGEVANPQTTDPEVQGVRRLIETLAAERRLDATVIQTVGSKGHDGLLIAVVAG